MKSSRRGEVSIDGVTSPEYKLINHFFHDFKGGLSTVIACIEALQEGLAGPVDPNQQPWLERASHKCRHMVSLINDFRDLTQIEDGEYPREPATVDLAALMGRMREDLEVEAARRRIQVRFDVHGDLPIARFPADLFPRLLTHLATVLLECTRAGGQLVVEVSSHEIGCRGSVRVDLFSEGVEFAQEVLDTVFDKVAQTETGLQLGRGYTLMFCRAAAKYLGGDLKLGPWPGGGTRADVAVPLALVGVGRAGRAGRDAAGAGPSGADGGGR
ncbi:MAG TPA: HAMP domain-containing sensor histidine kinase [Myxococcota bacterium]|nr:HAMP domain-containing sensor histidine kinase [Myxococcota bacterium]